MSITQISRKGKSGRVSLRAYPQSIEAEKTLLCSLFLDNSKFIDIFEIVDAKDFYDERNAKLFEVLKELYSENIPFDFITVKNALDEKGLSEKIGITYLTSLTDYLPVPANAKYYAEIIHKKAILRELISMSYEVAEISYDEPEDIEETLNVAENRLVNIALKIGKKKIVSADDINNTNIEIYENVMHGVKIQNRAIWGLVGATSAGKTDFALDIAKEYAENGGQVVYCQFEGTKQDLILRAQKKGTWKETVTFLLKPSLSLILGHIKQNQRFGKKTFVVTDYLQRFARFLQAQQAKQEKSRAYEGLRIYVNQIYEFFDNLRQEYDITVLFIMSMSKAEISTLAQKDKIAPQEILNSIKESGDVQYDLDYAYSMTFNSDPNYEKSYIGRFTTDGQRRYMQLRVAKEARIGEKLQNSIYEFAKENDWSGYALLTTDTDTTTQIERGDKNGQQPIPEDAF